MTTLRARIVLANHFFKDFDRTAQVINLIRNTYNGPLSLAWNFMVGNITQDDIRGW